MAEKDFVHHFTVTVGAAIEKYFTAMDDQTTKKYDDQGNEIKVKFKKIEPGVQVMRTQPSAKRVCE